MIPATSVSISVSFWHGLLCITFQWSWIVFSGWQRSILNLDEVSRSSVNNLFLTFWMPMCICLTVHKLCQILSVQLDCINKQFTFRFSVFGWQHSNHFENYMGSFLSNRNTKLHAAQVVCEAGFSPLDDHTQSNLSLMFYLLDASFWL